MVMVMVMVQCLLAGNYPSSSHQQNDSGVGPLEIEMDPLKFSILYLEGVQKIPSLWHPVLTLIGT